MDGFEGHFGNFSAALASFMTMAMPTTDRGTWFAEEIERLLPDLYGAALAMAKERADAEDVVGEAVAKAWTRLDSLEDPSRFRGWVFRILTNEFCSRRRAARAGRSEERR